MPATTTSTAAISVPRLLVGLAIDYFRWTQLVPMITVWAFLLLMIGAMLLVNFQQQSFLLFEWGVTTYEAIFGPVEPEHPATQTGSAAATETKGAETEGGAITFTDEDFMPWVLRAWAIIALTGWLLGMLRARVFGPREPMRLKSKLGLAGIAAVACAALFGFAYFFGSEEFQGSPVGWMLMFTGLPLGVWLVSAYSLAVAHGLDMLRRRVSRADATMAPSSYNRE